MGGEDLDAEDYRSLLAYDPGCASLSCEGYERYMLASLASDFEGAVNDFRVLKLHTGQVCEC